MSLSKKKPLVVLTRSVEGVEPWMAYLKKRGADVYFFPTIEIVPVTPTPKVKNVLKNISDFDWIIFTSAAAVRSLKNLTEKSNISPVRMPKIAVIGGATATATRAADYHVSFQPSTPSSAALAFGLEPVRGRSVLLLRSSLAAHDLPKVLTARGAIVTDLVIYKTVFWRDPDPTFEKLLKNNKIDFLIFASPSAVHGFFQRVPKTLYAKALALPAVAIGSSVNAALKKAKFRNIRVAKEPGIEGIVASF